MRVSNNMGYEQVRQNVQRNREEMFKLQNEAATNKRINKPSDDPVGTAKVLAARTNQLGTEQYIKNIEQAKGFLNYTDTALGELTEVISKAKELALGQANEAGSNAVTRMTVATEVEQLYNSAVNVGNRRLGDRYIFGGYKTTQTPFDADGNYRGDSGSIMIETSKGIFTPVNMTGDKVFLGAGDASITNIPENRRGVHSINEEPPEHESDKAPKLELRGPASENKVLEEAQGLRGGKEKTEAQKDAQNGESIFGVMRELTAGLKTNDTATIQNTLERLDDALEQVVMLRSQVGTRVQALDAASESLAAKKVEDATTVSQVEDADAFEVFSDITKNENILKATLQTSGKMIQPSLLDFLR